ncbi:hypothetical protein CMI42_02670 [Candidatus Pacearchaeota archaeon]|nr:hypothetical protein [Candidatus Pacearchaeota archaeon]|tara:strand:- start:854 stop:1324 length:471 start_codon:yes stop_codon:yes gene_type:complete
MICNATPIICLSKIKQLSLLRKLFSKIVITSKVRDEILVKGKEGFLDIEKALGDKWIIIKDPRKEIDFGVDMGENSALNLASEMSQTLIIDDAYGIKVAKAINIDFIRTTSVLLIGLKDKIISKNQTKSLLKKLVEVGYYISPPIYSGIIEIIDKY